MNIVDRILTEIILESPPAPAPVIAPPKPAAPPAPSKPRPGTRPTIPTRRPGVAPRPKAKRDERDARTYPKATDVSHFTSVQASGTPNFNMAEDESGAVAVPPPPADDDEGFGPQPGNLSRICDQIERGDRVTIIAPGGQKVTGQASARNPQHGYWMLSSRDQRGRPNIASEDSIISVKRDGRTIYGKI